jgi:hypothetical protein
MISIDFVNDPNLSYEMIVERLKQYANIQRQKFLADDFSDSIIHLSKLEKGEIPFKVYEYFKELCFFPDEEIVRKLRAIGLKEKSLLWFVKIEEIISTIDAINNREIIKISHPKSFFSLLYYVHTKISVLPMEDDLMQYNSRSMSSLEREYVNYKRRKKSRATSNNKEKDAFGNLLFFYETLLLKIAKSNEASISLMKGHVEKLYLGGFFKEFVIKDSPKLSDRQAYIELYDLIRLIVKDIELPDFKILGEYERLRAIDGYKSVDIFKARKVERILQPRTKL